MALHLNVCVFELEITVLLLRGEKYLLYFVEKRLQKIIHIDMNEIMFHFLKILLFKKLFSSILYFRILVTILSKWEPEVDHTYYVIN